MQYNNVLGKRPDNDTQYIHEINSYFQSIQNIPNLLNDHQDKIKRISQKFSMKLIFREVDWRYLIGEISWDGYEKIREKEGNNEYELYEETTNVNNSKNVKNKKKDKSDSCFESVLDLFCDEDDGCCCDPFDCDCNPFDGDGCDLGDGIESLLVLGLCFIIVAILLFPCLPCIITFIIIRKRKGKKKSMKKGKKKRMIIKREKQNIIYLTPIMNSPIQQQIASNTVFVQQPMQVHSQQINVQHNPQMIVQQNMYNQQMYSQIPQNKIDYSNSGMNV